MHLARPSKLSNLRHRSRSQSGEGVISAAIAVLVMAFLGVAMWFAFSTIFDNAASTTGDLVGQIGQ